MDDHAERSRIQALFREVNDRIEGIGVSFAGGRPERRSMLQLVCECGDGECFEMIEVLAAEYEVVRANANRFITKKGHETPELEEVVESNDRFSIVRKVRPGVARRADLDAQT